MPLCADDYSPVDVDVTSENILQSLLAAAPQFKQRSINFKQLPCCTVNDNVLYVGQREYAVVDPLCQGAAKFIASDEATTCHIAALIHKETKVVGLAHFDSIHIKQGVAELIQFVQGRVVCNRPDIDVLHLKLNLYMVGGFMDDGRQSQEISSVLLYTLHQQSPLIRVEVACIDEMNNTVNNGLNFPALYGLGIRLDNLTVQPMEYTGFQPDQSIKTCRMFCAAKGDGSDRMLNVYNHDTHQIEVGPFNYNPMKNLNLWLSLPDHELLKYTSTSPDQERPSYCTNTRNAIHCMIDHPRPMVTLFPSNKPRCYELTNGQWVKATNT